MSPEETKIQDTQKEISAETESVEVVSKKLISMEPKVVMENMVKNSGVVEQIKTETETEELSKIVEVVNQETELAQEEPTKVEQVIEQPKVEQAQTEQTQVAPKVQAPQQQSKVNER